MREPAHSGRRSRRRGAVLLLTVGCLTLLMLLVGTLVRSARSESKLAQSAERRLQAEWLIQSAIGRAAVRLATDSGYAGEVWRVPPSDLDGRYGGVVTIKARESTGSPGQRRVAVTVDYPDRPELRIRRTRSVTVAAGAGR